MTRALSTLGFSATLMMVSGTAGAAESRWNCTVAPASTYTQQTNIQLPLAGSWIGNYVAVTNETGTRTIPGLFGGSGNTAIPFSSTVKPKVSITNTRPTGTFQFGFHAATGAVDVSNLLVDTLAGQTGTISTSMLLTYSTFRTAQPTSTFIGLTNVDVPVDSGSLTAATAAQSGAAIGVATPNADGTFAFAVTVPVTISVAGTALGQPFTSTSPAAMALTGTFSIVGSAISLTSQGAINETVPVPAPPPLVSAPFDLPTIFPAGQVARLLISGTFADGSSTTTGSSSLVMNGVLAPIIGDINGDGVVNGADLGLLLSGWGQPGPTDLNNDGITNGFDLGVLLTNWS
ncbi:MAG: hypothetical protein DWH71_04060 [Planctomycetota bacterium]|nr:MAG: hypothetical protein DWH71_04060 [Planctomycetota bacterium]